MARGPAAGEVGNGSGIGSDDVAVQRGTEPEMGAD
jgi:hypothetical protein